MILEQLRLNDLALRVDFYYFSFIAKLLSDEDLREASLHNSAFSRLSPLNFQFFD